MRGAPASLKQRRAAQHPRQFWRCSRPDRLVVEDHAAGDQRAVLVSAEEAGVQHISLSAHRNPPLKAITPAAPSHDAHGALLAVRGLWHVVSKSEIGVHDRLKSITSRITEA